MKGRNVQTGSFSTRGNGFRPPGFLPAVMLACLTLGGCGQNRAADERGGGPAEAEQLLRQMLATYQQADTYSDQGVLRLQYRQGGQRHLDEAPLAVTLVRPNQVRVQAYQLTLACDGRQFRARIADEPTGDIDGQFLVRPAPEQITLPEFSSDPVLYDVLSSGLGRFPAQLELLLAPDALELVFDEQVAKRLLGAQKIEDHPCHRVEVQMEDGPFVFWIDQQTMLLRRLEYPSSGLAAQMAGAGPVNQVELVADFRQARFARPAAERNFDLPLPEGSRTVGHFVLPPQPLPSDLFGRRPEDFFFTDVQGGRITRNALRGQPAVLVWFHDHPLCRTSLQQLDQAREKLGDRPVTFYAVCTEPSQMSDQQVQRLLQRWQVELPVVRDLEASGRDVFQIPWAPTLVVLDAEGTVQIFEVGANPHLETYLPEVLERLLAGEDLAGTVLEQFEREQAEYRRQLQIASGKTDM